MKAKVLLGCFMLPIHLAELATSWETNDWDEHVQKLRRYRDRTFGPARRDAGPVRLELQAERELADADVADLSRRTEGREELAKGRNIVDDVRRADGGPRIGEVRVVEEIEEIRTEGQVEVL
jgi:hypothetical protein